MHDSSILVVGDSMLDRYLEGAVERISPEAPVPILRLGREWQRAGGAANVAVNLAALERPCLLVTLIGKDEAGAQLEQILRSRRIELQAVRSPELTTTQKIRAVCRRQQLLRIDIEHPVGAECRQALNALVIDAMPRHRWALFSDYGKGCLNDSDMLIRQAAMRDCRVLIDPKGRDFTRYRGAWLLKPNESEAQLAVGAWRDEADFEARMTGLRESLGVQHLLVTRGEKGMALFSAHGQVLRVSAQAREVYDVSGAGDTVLAALVSGLAAGRTLEDSVRMANRAAGVVVGKFGTATATLDELRAGGPGTGEDEGTEIPDDDMDPNGEPNGAPSANRNARDLWELAA